MQSCRLVPLIVVVLLAGCSSDSGFSPVDTPTADIRQPDLTIDSAERVSFVNPNVDRAETWAVVICNEGAAVRVGETFRMAAYDDAGNRVGTLTHDAGLGLGLCQEVMLDITIGGGRQLGRLEIDSSSQIAETNETNNVLVLFAATGAG